MQGVPDDLFQSDMNSFPTTDPRITAELAKQHQQALKAQKANEAAAAKERKEEAAKVAKAVKMPVKAPPAKVVETVGKREMKAHKIRLYYEKLGHKLSSKCPKTLPKTEEGLDELLAAIECELHSAGGIEQAGGLYLNGLFAFEQFTQQYNPLGLMLSGPAAGLSATVAQNKDKWNDLMTEVAIANAEWCKCKMVCC